MTTGPEVDALVAAAEKFTVPLRMGHGIDEPAYERLVATLNRCASAWRGQEVVPKLAANVLVDLYPAVQASSYLYEDEYGKIVRDRAEKIGDLVRSCVAV